MLTTNVNAQCHQIKRIKKKLSSVLQCSYVILIVKTLLKSVVVHQCGGLKTTTILIRTKTSVNLVKTKEKLYESS